MPLKLYMQLPLFPLHLFPFKHFSLAFPHFPNAFALYLGFWPHNYALDPVWAYKPDRIMLWKTLGKLHFSSHRSWEHAVALISCRTPWKINHKNSQPASANASPSFATRASNTLSRSLTARQINRRCCCCSSSMLLLFVVVAAV